MPKPDFLVIAAGLVLAEGCESITSLDDIADDNELIVVRESMEDVYESHRQELVGEITESLENAYAAGLAANTQTIGADFKKALMQAIIDAAANDELDRGDGIHKGNLGDIFDRAEKAFLAA